MDQMTSIAERTAPAVSGLTAAFMIDPSTYQTAAEHGYSGLDFYFAGRAGVLGDVDAGVVASAMVFFHPEQVRKNWDQGRSVLEPVEAAKLFATCLGNWSGEHLTDDVDWDRLGDLAGRITAEAPEAGAPLFAGWRNLPSPADSKLAALHHMNALRELRMARHAGAVLAVGLRPDEAVLHSSPGMAPLFGWEARELDPDVPTRWDEAETLTNRATGRDYTALTPGEADELASLCEAARQAMS